jgi:hypothetical protein
VWGYANLLVQGSHSASVLELLKVVLSSDAATLTLGDELHSALVGGRSEVELQNSGTKVGGKLQEGEWGAGLDDNGLKAVVEHVGCDKLELLWSNELDGLAETSLLSESLRIVSHNCHSVRFEFAYFAMNSVVLEADVDSSGTAKSS